jgi:hypothetical protein
VEEHGGVRAAERALGLGNDTIGRALRSLQKTAARKGHAPGHWNSGVAPGYVMGKVTITRVNEDGTLRWERQHPEVEGFIEAIKGAVDGFVAGVGPIPVAPPKADRGRDVIPWINIGDAHLGMLAYEAQTNEHFNLEIAERELCTAISMLIDEMGEYERIVINDLGDFTHYENERAETEASGHKLDAAAFYGLMITTYSRVMRFIVGKVMEKANIVDVIVNQGNHSRKNDFWMSELLRVAYGHTGRVNVLNNDNVFIGYRMGNTLVMTHHSDKCKPARLAQVMTSDFRIDYGETEYHYIDIGHIHHGMVLKEHPDIGIESFNTLAPKDKFAHDGGWRSRSSITAVFRSRTYGDIGRRVLPIREVRDRIAAEMAAAGRPVYMPTVRRAFAA